MNILEKLLGNDYPKFKTVIYANGGITIVTLHRTLSPNHVKLDSPTYVETKFKKQIPILKGIVVSKNEETDVQTISVVVKVNGKFNGITHLNNLVHIAATISGIAEDKLSEPEAIKNIGLDCKPFIDNEPEETQADA